MIGLQKKIFSEPLWPKPNGSGFFKCHSLTLNIKNQLHVLNPTHDNLFQQSKQ